jgi:uncharacterized membrane protein
MIENYDATINLILQLLPVIIVIGTVAGVLNSLMHFGGSSPSSDIGTIEHEQPDKDAEEILRRRFAMGEISEEEYTSRMSRL